MQLIETINGQDGVRAEIYSAKDGHTLRLVDADGMVLRQSTEDKSIHWMREQAEHWIAQRVQLNG